MALASVLALVAAAAAITSIGKGTGPSEEPLAGEVALHTLPAQAQQTHMLILAGGPFPYDKDGSVFFNRERLLPQQPRGFYREYTVKTPGARDRGARRIVCGGSPPTAPSACYYTGDHYASFTRYAWGSASPRSGVD